MADIRVLVVDDCEATRRLLVHMIDKQEGMSVVGDAADGVAALVAIEKLRPDVVTLDLQMPQMDGLATLQALRERFGRLPVVVCSSLTAEGARVTVDALLAGADDFICKIPPLEKNTNRVRHLQDELREKIHAVFQGKQVAAVTRPAVSPTATPPVTNASGTTARPVVAPVRPEVDGNRLPPKTAFRAGRIELLVIGASTGGPAALAQLIGLLPEELPVPICIVQHMPAAFTPLLAQTLGRRVHRRIVEATDGMALEPGSYYVAPGDRHMLVRREKVLGCSVVLNEGPQLHGCRPAVDELFRSAGNEFGAGCLAVVLTGMGCDGVSGARVIRDRGGVVLAQDRESCVVWGMPRHVAEAGLAQAVLPIAELATEIQLRLAQPASKPAVANAPMVSAH